MTNCTIYNKATGEILSYGTVSDETLELYVNQGHDVLLDVHGDPAKQYVVGDELVDYTADELAARAVMQPGQVWSMPSRTVVDGRVLADTIASAADKIDAAADAARLTVSPPGRDLEYQRAEVQAQAYKDAAYTGDVPPCVDSWARAKQWSPRNAAIDILATASLWYKALDQIRDLRLNAKEAARRVTGACVDVDAIVLQFQTDLTTLMKGLT
ncbi:hypothetical protein [Massilia sp. 9096]|uniref:hypothetical protein n=1 Tax=Massilia sp. 9096 TaxID=1500894 RepID=UPI00069042B5|nr:hypothetical protein [Massilia sp. 9096]